MSPERFVKGESERTKVAYISSRSKESATYIPRKSEERLVGNQSFWFHIRQTREPFLLGAHGLARPPLLERAMRRAARERCLLRTSKQHDPVSLDKIGRERTSDTAVAINLAGPVEL